MGDVPHFVLYVTYEAGRHQWEFGKWASKLMGRWSCQPRLEPPAAGVKRVRGEA